MLEALLWARIEMSRRVIEATTSVRLRAQDEVSYRWPAALFPSYSFKLVGHV